MSLIRKLLMTYPKRSAKVSPQFCWHSLPFAAIHCYETTGMLNFRVSSTDREGLPRRCFVPEVVL
jgi:hypothetical protein